MVENKISWRSAAKGFLGVNYEPFRQIIKFTTDIRSIILDGQ